MRGRWRFVGRWWFLGSVAVLALNDHVLKAHVPGWWTGKLSDVVGPVVVATLLATITGRNIAVAATACGFVALKTVPGVAELAAPLLGGGVTRRDATDLIGLAALVPAWWAMTAPRAPLDDQANASDQRGRQPVPAPVRRRVLALFGAATALVATTATSPAEDPVVGDLRVAGDTLYVRYHQGYGYSDGWAESTDGGFTWTLGDGPDVQAQTLIEGDRMACRSDRWCFESTDDEIRERPPGGEWQTSFRLSSTERDMFEYRSDSTPRTLFGRLIVAPVGTREHVVVSSGEQGVLVMDDRGSWHRVGVLDATPTDIGGALWPLQLAETLFWIAAVVAFLAVLFRSPGPATGLSAGERFLTFVLVLAVSGIAMVGAAIAWVVGESSRADPAGIGAVMLFLMAIAVGAPFALSSKNGRAARRATG